MPEIISQLQTFYQTDRLGHAYIIESESKLEWLSRLCADLGVSEHDYYSITPEGTSIKVDQIRVLQDRLSRSPLSSMHLVVLSPADQMNTSAANSLLKLLEEPPGRTLFLLVTCHSRKLMPTIRSRAQVLRETVAIDGKWQSHPKQALLMDLYQHAPVMDNDDEPIALSLLEAQKQGMLVDVIGEYSKQPLVLIQSALIVAAYLTKQYPCNINWDIYYQLLALKKTYQVAMSLNDKAVADQVVLLLQRMQAS